MEVASCPNCSATLEAEEVGNALVYCCRGCRGVLLSRAALALLVGSIDVVDAQRLGRILFAVDFPTEPHPGRCEMNQSFGTDHRYLSCPTCRQLMSQVALETDSSSGSCDSLHVCIAHGLWLPLISRIRFLAQATPQAIQLEFEEEDFDRMLRGEEPTELAEELSTPNASAEEVALGLLVSTIGRFC